MALENKTEANGATAEMEVEEDYMEILERNKDALQQYLLSLGVGLGAPPSGGLLAAVKSALGRREALEEAVASFCSGQDQDDEEEDEEEDEGEDGGEDGGGDDRKVAGESGGGSDSDENVPEEESSRGSMEIGNGREN